MQTEAKLPEFKPCWHFKVAVAITGTDIAGTPKRVLTFLSGITKPICLLFTEGGRVIPLYLRICFVLTLNHFLGLNFPETFHSLHLSDTSKPSLNHFPTIFSNKSMHQRVAKEPEYKSHIKPCLAQSANLNPTFLPLTFRITLLEGHILSLLKVKACHFFS